MPKPLAVKLRLNALYGVFGERGSRSRVLYPTRVVHLPAGVERIVHVLGPVLARNLKRPHDYASHAPVVAVRDAARPKVAIVARHVEILGPCRIDYTPDQAVPGTEGRAIAVMRTRAELVLHLDRKKARKR